jgi:hypothetical protein
MTAKRKGSAERDTTIEPDMKDARSNRKCWRGQRISELKKCLCKSWGILPMCDHVSARVTTASYARLKPNSPPRNTCTLNSIR